MIWFAVVFVIFSMSDTKRSSYILPLYPALAILVAWGIQMLSWHRKELIQYWKISMVLLGFGLIGVCAGITFLWWGHIPTEVTGVALGLFGASLGFPLLLHLLAKEKNTNVVIMLLSMVALGYSIGYTGWYQPVYDRYYRSPKHYIEPMKKLVNNSPLLHIGSIRSHDLFYFNRNEMPAWNPKRGLKVLKNGYLLSRLPRDPIGSCWIRADRGRPSRHNRKSPSEYCWNRVLYRRLKSLSLPSFAPGEAEIEAPLFPFVSACVR